MTYANVVAELESLGVMPVGIPKLEPIRRALNQLDYFGTIDPKKNIVIAGTNGKGSIAATLSRLLVSAHQRVGLYTSPHLVTTCERIRIQDQTVTEDQLVWAYQSVRDIIHREHLTHFEALTLLAVVLFYSHSSEPSVDWAIWEVGLGGLWDATNAIPHHYCGIGRLGLDHQAILGNTLEEIAFQKFGVIGKNNQVVYSPMDLTLQNLRNSITLQTDCRWIAARSVELQGLHHLVTNWGSANMKLCGWRAAENTALALTLFEEIGFHPEAHLGALEQVDWPGRYAQWEKGDVFRCPFYLSGDHNLQGVDSLIEILSHFHWNHLHLIVGIAEDKDAEAMLEKLSHLPRSKLYLTETAFKPMRLDQYPERFQKIAKQKEREVMQIISTLRDHAVSDDLVIVTGSLYLVGKVLSQLGTLSEMAGHAT